MVGDSTQGEEDPARNTRWMIPAQRPRVNENQPDIEIAVLSL
jgi:hypothetical protein